AAFRTRRLLAAVERLGRTALQLLRQFLVKAFDARELIERYIGDFFQLAEAFGHEQLRERLVDVELFLEHRRALDEFALALLARVSLGHDVDLAASELACKTHILAAAADGETQLIVRNDDLDAPVILVDHDALHRSRLKG